MTRAAQIVAVALMLAVAGCGGGDGDDDRRAPAPKPADTRLVAFPDGPLVGIADNSPQMLEDPRFVATGIDRIRVLVPWDDVDRPSRRRTIQDSLLRRARSARKEVLASFFRSYRTPEQLPSVRDFSASVDRFRRRYPWVRHFSTWSEPNARSQPTSRSPERTAAFYRALRRTCSRGRCTVTTGDYRLDGSRASARWLRRYVAAVGRGPHIWGLSSFEDIRRRTTAGTRALLRRTEGPVWVGQTGAVLKDARTRRPDPGLQRRRMQFLVDVYPAVSRRIRRLYVYTWRAAATELEFDSALMSFENEPRPAFREFTSGIGRIVP